MFFLLVWPSKQKEETKCSDLLEEFEKLTVDDNSKSVMEFSEEVGSSSESSGGYHRDL